MIIVKTLIDKGVNNTVAVLTATDIVKCITAAYGGVTWYLPKQDSVRYAERAAAIMAEFDGKNHQTLAKKHGLSSVWIYKLINRESEKGRGKPDINGIAAVLKVRQERGENV